MDGSLYQTGLSGLVAEGGATPLVLLTSATPAHHLAPKISTPLYLNTSPNPNPDPLDPHVFGPPGSVPISKMYGSGSGSFYHQAKKVKKTLIPTVF